MDDRQIATAAFGTVRVGSFWDTLEAPEPTDRSKRIRLGVPYQTWRIAERRDIQLARYFALVRFGMCNAAHLFRGLKRRMKYMQDMEADKRVLAYVWQPPYDAKCGTAWDGASIVDKVPSPPNEVFVVLVRMYDDADTNGISGEVLHWSWVDGDESLRPSDHGDRYGSELW